MQLRRFLQLAAFVLILVGMSFGNPLNDPKMIIGGGGNTPHWLDTVTVTGNTFSFTAPNGNSPPCTVNNVNDPDCSFINGNNYTWTSLTFFISPVQGNLSCSGGFFFTNCTVNNTLGIITFSGGPGIGPDGFFNMITQGFQAPTSFTGNANATPEPASLVLLLTGAAALFRRRRK